MARRGGNCKLLLCGFMKAAAASASFGFPGVSSHLKGTAPAPGEVKA